ncbi:NAD(P)/FAD-dependent oxidoreductase [Mycobacterium sp. SMC-4]|uniref:NAD(P)/FAD-dependent oxidoreductase n=1 Tax=Mycobacterium sp. SMC-4 TaxID=2857059 RepID=UPI003D07C914
MNGREAFRACWWLDDAVRDDGRTPALEANTRADVCIVGGGFTGLWTALNIKKHAPDADVVLLEREVCGSGASGRNGGFAMTMWHHFLLLENLCGTAQALRIAQASTDAITEIGEVCEASGMDVGFRQHGWIWTASNRSQQGMWRATVDRLESHGVKLFEQLTPADVARRTGSKSNIDGVFEPGLASVQPAAVARALRLAALENGVRIHEYSPMTQLDRSETPVVRTARGSVTAGRVVMALNAWSGKLPELKGRFLTLGGDMFITDPVPELIERIGIEPGLLISDSRLLVHYFHVTPDGRLAFGKAGGTLRPGNSVGTKYEGPSRRADWVRNSMLRFYPEMAHVPITASWSGPVDRSMDGLPFFSRLGRPDIVAGLGYSGNGVGPSVLGGKILASMALDRDDEWSSCGLVREPPRGVPPEPFRFIGGTLIKEAVGLKERAEDNERRPNPLAVFMTKLAPPGLIPTDH